MSSRKRRGEAHVRLYRHELESAAYRSLPTDARALLIEFRALYDGRENRLFMSVREIQRRLGVGQRRAQKARDELLDRGFIKLLVPGGFSRKTRHATEYALTNEPLDPAKDGATAPKDFMRWEPQKKSSVVNPATAGSQSSYRDRSKAPRKGPDGSRNSYRKPTNEPPHGSQNSYTDKLPGTGCVSGVDVMARMALVAADERARLILCGWYVVLAHMQAQAA